MCDYIPKKQSYVIKCQCNNLCFDSESFAAAQSDELGILQDVPKSLIDSALSECLLGNLTHWGRATHICVNKILIIGPDNGLSSDRRKAIIWTNAGILLTGPLGINFSEIPIEIPIFSFKKIHLNLSSEKWRPFCLCLNVLRFCPDLPVIPYRLIWPTCYDYYHNHGHMQPHSKQ